MILYLISINDYSQQTRNTKPIKLFSKREHVDAWLDGVNRLQTEFYGITQSKSNELLIEYNRNRYVVDELELDNLAFMNMLGQMKELGARIDKIGELHD